MSPAPLYPAPAQALSPRESTVLHLVSHGLTNQEIADRLELSINSVKTYLRCAYGKIGVERRSQAIVWVMAQAASAPILDPAPGSSADSATAAPQNRDQHEEDEQDDDDDQHNLHAPR